ncbi:MAG: lipopolysaccharide heptosyltransferase II [Nitrospinae bacterium]|nr:lipopolysaccharide heptosyltransferase II [Nitrospinota bacterium]
MTQDLRKLLVIRYRSIGDILLSNPTLAALRVRYPRAQIHFLIDDRFEELLYANPNVDKLILWRRSGKATLREEWEFISRLRAERYDAAIDLQGGPRGAITTLLSGAPIRCGQPYRLRNKLCYNRYAPSGAPDEHSWRVQFHAAEPLGVTPPDKPELFLKFSGEQGASARKKLEDAGLIFDRPLVILHPGARVREKRWPAENMGRLARWLADERRLAVILAGSAADAEEIKTIRRASGYALPFFTDLGLGELAAMISTCDLLVANDSGPMHMAGALGTPCVALFGPSDPSLWAPLGNKCAVVTPDPMECMPCDQKGCARGDDYCMARIPLEDVQQAVDRLRAL